MKRYKHLFYWITTPENLELADKRARRGKRHQPAVIAHMKNAEQNLIQLQHDLKHRLFTTSEYTTFHIYEPKERLVHRLPYFPDRIVHHAILNELERIFVSTFVADTYSCIKGKGVHAAGRAVKKALRDVAGTKYCLKLDIRKFYPSVDHDVLKGLLRIKFKDPELLWLIDNIIDSAPGLPIGNYLSQYLANYYLAYFDHWVKEQLNAKYYFRYADDLVLLSDSKDHLHGMLRQIREYLQDKLKLEVKSNYQVFPVHARGIDFVGYKFYHTHTLLRKSIKQNFARMLAKRRNHASTASYVGWCKHADTRHLLKKLNIKMKNFADLEVPSEETIYKGEKITIMEILNTDIEVHQFCVKPSKFTPDAECLHMQIRLNGQDKVIFTVSAVLIRQISSVGADNFPFQTRIVKRDKRYIFT